MPEELVFANPAAPDAGTPRRTLAKVRGRTVLCEEAPEGWRIAALLSTDPMDFLAPDLAPGAPVPSPPDHRTPPPGPRSQPRVQG